MPGYDLLKAMCRPVLVDRFMQAGRHGQLHEFRRQERRYVAEMRDFRNLYCRRFLPLLACAALLIGCEDDEKQKAIEDAERSRMSSVGAEGKLARAQREIADLQELLDAVMVKRDVLEAQVKELLEDQGKAVATAEEAQEGIRNLTAHANRVRGCASRPNLRTDVDNAVARRDYFGARCYYRGVVEDS